MLSQTAEYALRAAVFLGEEDPAPRTARQIAEAIQVPGGYLSKVLQAMCRAGIVRSQRGLGGGFRLARSPDQLTVLDVVRVVDPLRRVRTCPLDLPEHAERLCPLHQQLDDAMAAIEETFRCATISNLVRPPASVPEQKNNCREHCGGACKRDVGCSDNAHPHNEDPPRIQRSRSRNGSRSRRSRRKD